MSEPLIVPEKESQLATDIPPPSMSAYEVSQKIWMQPPQPLPGPDGHPFFKRFAPNAYGSLLQLDSTAVASDTRSTTDAEIAPTGPAIEMPLVYPFVPAPSISMEPVTPGGDHDSHAIESSTASVSLSSTPSLSFSNSDGQESSPEARPTSANRSKDSRIVKPSNTGLEEDEMPPPGPATATKQSPAQENLDKMGVEAICILTYMRAIPNSETSEPAVIANGQIWRSADKKEGWRRHQWIVDVR
ncbi:hypothetical protein E2P81_ATG05951 [Venturia nashicola]|nr:hypothetical protein E2P81_ATG05951 [Venturia nashicola]